MPTLLVNYGRSVAKSYPGAARVHTVNGTILPQDALLPCPTGAERTYKVGTLRAVVRQLGLDWEAFNKV